MKKQKGNAVVGSIILGLMMGVSIMEAADFLQAIGVI